MHLPFRPRHPIHVLDHVDRNPDGARLIGDRPCDRLTDPPGRIRRELEALGVVELVDRPHQAEVALLDQVEQLHAPPRVPLRDADHQAQVGLGEFALGPLAPADRTQQHPFLTGRQIGRSVQLVDPCRGDLALLDQLGESPLVLHREQVDLADLAQVHAHRVGGAVVAPRARLADTSITATAQQLLVVVGRCGGRLVLDDHPAPATRRRVVGDVVDLVVDVDAVTGHRRLDLGEHVAGQLDVAQHVGDVLGMHGTGASALRHEIAPFTGIDADERHTVDTGAIVRCAAGCRISPHRCAPLIVDPANLATTRRPPWHAIDRCRSASRCRVGPCGPRPSPPGRPAGRASAAHGAPPPRSACAPRRRAAG